MEIKKLYRFYTFGWDYRQMITGFQGFKVKEALRVTENFLKFLKDHNLVVTMAAIDEKLEIIRMEIKKQQIDEHLSEENSKKMIDFSKSIETTLDAELELREAYVLTEKRLGLNSLVNHIDMLFESGIYQKLPQIVRIDFYEAGKCIAFERPTAAAFHILRGTEGMLKTYYLYIIKKNRLKNPMWDPMIKELITKNKSPGPLLSVLDNIRTNFRNPTMHPETTYDIEEVQSLFNLCSDAVSRIIKEMNNTQKKN